MVGWLQHLLTAKRLCSCWHALKPHTCPNRLKKSHIKRWDLKLAYLADWGVAQAGAHTSDTAGEHAAEAVGGEGGAKHLVDLVLQGVGDLVTAQVHTGCSREGSTQCSQ